MSYELQVFHTVEGVDPRVTAEATLERDSSELNPGGAVPEKEERKANLAAALIQADPNLIPFRFDHAQIAQVQGITETEARRKFRHVELNAPYGGNGVQVTLFDDTASVTVPYWHGGARAASTWDEVWACLKVFQARDFAVYDPQLEKVLDLVLDRGAVLKMYQHGVGLTASLGERSSAARKPWWRVW